MTDTGLIYAYRLDEQGGGEVLTWEAIDRVWNDRESPVWLHFDYSHPRVQEWLGAHSGLDRLVVEALLVEESRPRADLLGDGLMVSLRGVNLNPGSDPEDMVAIRIWTDGHRVISTRKRAMLSAAHIAKQLQVGQGPCSAAEFLVILSGQLMSRMENVIQETEDQVESLEEEMLSGDGQNLRVQLVQLRRTVIALRRYLAPQRDAMLQLQGLRLPWIGQDERERFREVTDHLIRYLENLNLVRERTAVAQEELSNRLAEEMNSRMYVLSCVAALFLPLGFLTGLLGINVGGIPGAENPLSFWIFSGFLVLLVVLQVVVFRRHRWF